MTESNKPTVEATVRNIRRKTRRKYSSEEKIRIVLEGIQEHYWGDSQGHANTQAAGVEIQKMPEEGFINKVRIGFDGNRLLVSRLRAAHHLAMGSVGVKYGVQALQLALKLHIESLNQHLSQEKRLLSALEFCFVSLPEAKALLSVNGISILTGATILAEIGDFLSSINVFRIGRKIP